MAVAWDAGLPWPPTIEGHGASGKLNAVLFETGSGRTRKRKRASTPVETKRLSFVLTAAEKATWDSFWVDDLVGGAVNFTAGGDEYSITSDVELAPTGGKWRLSFSAEMV